MEVKVKIAPPNGKPHRGVTLTDGDGRQHYEEIRLANGFERQQYIKRAEQRFGVPGGQLAGVDEEIIQEALAAVEAAHAPVTYSALSCADLVATKFELRWLVEHLIVDGQPLLLAGPKKSLKTSFLIDLALALAKGAFFLGKFRVPQAARVGLMTGESGLATIQETIVRVANAMGVDPAEITNLVIADTVPQFGHLEHMDALRGWVTGNELAVLIVDPCYMAMDGGDASNLFIMGGLLRSISELCQELNVTLILAHHTKKGVADPYQPPELEHIAWSGFQEFARQWLLVGRREKYEPGTGEHRLWLSGGGSAGHGGLWAVDVSEGTHPDRCWDVQIMTAEEARSGARDREQDAQEEKQTARQRENVEAAKKRVCEVMAKKRFRDGETSTVIRDTAGLHDRWFKPALGELLEEEAVEACDVFKPPRKKPHPGYKLSDTHP